MAKITRQTHKVFGASGATTYFAQVGSMVGGTPLKTKDLATIMALPAWNDGLQDTLYGANKNLLLQDLNAILYEHSEQMAYLFQAGVPEWDAETPYFKGSVVQRTDISGSATGELYVSTADNNVGQTLPVQTNSAQWTYMNPPQVPPGTVLDFMGVGVPAGFLWADGSAVSRATYAALFAALSITLAGNLTNASAVVTGLPNTANLRQGWYASGVGVAIGATILSINSSSQVTLSLPATSSQTPGSITFGPNPLGDGATTFNLPDTTRRVTVGAGGAGTAVLPNQVGAKGGEETHVLTVPEIPSHTHPVWAAGQTGGNLAGTAGYTSGGNLNTGAAGGGGAHNNMQPSLVATKIIKF